jgi:Zn-dependent peptidase ImmA (M78 family)
MADISLTQASPFRAGEEVRGSTTRSRRQEKEAEVFAAYLLIPEDKLNEKLREEWVKESPDPIPELAEEFQVSENFMRKKA